ncbi:nicotinate-nucleotide--dimethylbenzimidazole phosphoribosyltransferase [Paremcibacter congregatus]|uniref:nicotinate-nucleotide--dimethylbenzimidazole phosphoribosyltransferase n=1 Tax=Paremcibacter congregatus TaxID=2043170 RepID=UPI003A934826
MADQIIFTAEDLTRMLIDLPTCNQTIGDQARARQNNLTKPQGSLGHLEELAIWLASWQGRDAPSVADAHCLVFAGNHGIAAKGVSAYPAEVTAQMVMNFEQGGAAINQLCRVSGAVLKVVALELDRPTDDLSQGPAMTAEDCARALQVGRDAVPETADILLLGEMGIGNSTSAAALSAACFGGAVKDWTGPGTGLDQSGLDYKINLIEQAMSCHDNMLTSPFEILRRLGGRELAAIAGAVICARERGIPVILDGYICTAAAAVLTTGATAALDHCQVAHLSQEPGHRVLSEILGKRPILDLDMRLGEASGAAVALMVLQAAVAVHNGMATFAEAGVSEHE